MRRVFFGFVVVMSMLWSRCGSYADDGPELPPVAITVCQKLDGTQDGCGTTDIVFPCQNPPPAAVVGAPCGSHQAFFTSPRFDKVVPAGSAPGYKMDWSIQHLCHARYDCFVQNGALGPICAIDHTTLHEIFATQIFLNFDDPCNH